VVLRAVQAAELRSGDPDGEQGGCSEKGVRLANKMQVGPRIPVGIQLQKADVGPISGPTWRLSDCCVRGLLSSARQGRSPGARGRAEGGTGVNAEYGGAEVPWDEARNLRSGV
jgi:hypothetical protein